MAQDTTQYWYPFDKYYLDLRNLQRIQTDIVPNQTFKLSSKFAYRFKGLSIDKLGYKAKFFELTMDNGLKITDINTGITQEVTNKDKGLERYGQHFLFQIDGGVACIKHLSADYGFKIYKYDASGNELWAQTLEHTEKVKREKLEYYRPYLQYLIHTPQAIVFTSYDKNKEVTHLVDTETGKLSTFSFNVQGVILDTLLQSQVKGFLTLKDDSLKITNLGIDYLIKSEFVRRANSLESVQVADILVLALYNRIASGCDLIGVDMKTGKLLWKAEALQLKADHSKYYNKIWLSAFENKIMLEGMETQGRYLQVFDIQTGKRLWASDNLIKN